MMNNRVTTLIPLRTLIYAAVVTVLVVILVVQETTDTRGNTMAIPAFDRAAVDQVRIQGPEGTLVFNRSQESTAGTPVWTMDEAEYPVADGRISEILDELDALRRADIITGRGNAADYGLGDGNGTILRIFTGDTEPLALQLGDVASGGNAVYGRVNTSREIVLLPRALGTAVSTDPLRFRERTMVEIPADSIVEAVVTADGRQPIVVRRAIEDDDVDETPDDTSAADAAAPTADGVDSAWRAVNPQTGEAVAASALNAFIRELNALEASTFPEYLEEADADTDAPSDMRALWSLEPSARVTVEMMQGEKVEILLWDADGEERVPARVNTSPYDFVLPLWRAERLLLGVTSLSDEEGG